MLRHFTTSKKLPAFIARYVLHATLLASCCCCWNAAIAAAEVSRGVVDNRVADADRQVQPIAEANALRSRQTRSTLSEIEHPPTDEQEDDSEADSYPFYSSAAWEPEVEEADLLQPQSGEYDKRKWGDNKARVWGKRKWGDNRARVWGKRLSALSAGQHRQQSGATGGEQRAMAAAAAADFLRKFQVENRKLVDEAMTGNGEQSGKRKWGENKARVWG